ncbi:substrate-binding domain-containing protein [Maribacter aestuarii]|uniref:substrate-binding domain-containing protein n=1 Tax=Maribacter aestuarii TaxID=1130723 RepID=UPI00248BEA27|nr:substrate-binding domain-containing protein [Maribacter aestuarii]
MKKVRIIGVPEHFNLPWHLPIEEGAFTERGIDLQWRDIPEGTGKMCQLLEKRETDLAIILTEGIIKSITEGNPSKIIQTYIGTPLLWGIHVAANSEYSTIDDLKGTKAAISRYGSGSHLMAYVNAKNQGWDPSTLQFEIINNLDGAIEGLTSGKADYFMWEHFTTKPLVDQGVFRRLGYCPTPWPCFLLVGTNKFLKENGSTVDHILEIINMYTLEFRNIPSIDRTLSNRYGQQLEDIQQWMGITQWSQSQLPVDTLTAVQETLIELELINEKLPPETFLY